MVPIERLLLLNLDGIEFRLGSIHIFWKNACSPMHFIVSFCFNGLIPQTVLRNSEVAVHVLYFFRTVSEYVRRASVYEIDSSPFASSVGLRGTVLSEDLLRQIYFLKLRLLSFLSLTPT